MNETLACSLRLATAIHVTTTLNVAHYLFCNTSVREIPDTECFLIHHILELRIVLPHSNVVGKRITEMVISLSFV